MTRTFRPGALYMVTHRMARVLARFDGNGVWSIRGAYVPEEDIVDPSPEVDPPRVHDVQISLFARSLAAVTRWGVGE